MPDADEAGGDRGQYRCGLAERLRDWVTIAAANTDGRYAGIPAVFFARTSSQNESFDPFVPLALRRLTVTPGRSDPAPSLWPRRRRNHARTSLRRRRLHTLRPRLAIGNGSRRSDRHACQSNVPGRSCGHYPQRSRRFSTQASTGVHVQQVHEEVIGQLARTRRKHAV